MLFDDWPEGDRLAWTAARKGRSVRRSIHDPLPVTRVTVGDRAKFGKVNRRVVTPRKRSAVQWANLERAYGTWLHYLAVYHGEHTTLHEPLGAVSNKWMDGFLQWLQEHCRASTTHTYLQRLLQSFQVLEPKTDWASLGVLVRRLTPPAPNPTRDLDKLQHPAKLLALAEHLMDTADQLARDAADRTSGACLYRDGLILMLLTMTALRRGSLLRLSLGTTLQRAGEDYLIRLEAEDTKARRPELIPIHRTLNKWLDRYIYLYRPMLLAEGSSAAFFLSRDGRPMNAQAVHSRTCHHTRSHFGTAINPHRIRHCIATYTSMEHPEAIGDLHTVLQHRDLRVTERHYILASQLRGRRAHQDCLSAERRELSVLEAD